MQKVSLLLISLILLGAGCTQTKSYQGSALQIKFTYDKQSFFDLIVSSETVTIKNTGADLHDCQLILNTVYTAPLSLFLPSQSNKDGKESNDFLKGHVVKVMHDDGSNDHGAFDIYKFRDVKNNGPTSTFGIFGIRCQEGKESWKIY